MEWPARSGTRSCGTDAQPARPSAAVCRRKLCLYDTLGQEPGSRARREIYICEGKVYDLTDYIPEHPTPASVMEQWCGREATEGMRTKGYGRDHSRRAWAMMADYLIGELNDD